MPLCWQRGGGGWGGGKGDFCPCSSLCPSVCHTLWYRLCVNNFSHRFQRIVLKPCVLVVDIRKMCLWMHDGAKINFDRITAFLT